jgi:hypothetical protein
LDGDGHRGIFDLMKTELEAGKKWNCLSMKMGMILFLQSGPFIIGDRPY